MKKMKEEKKKKRQQYYWDVVKGGGGGGGGGGRLSITLFSCLELQYLCYAKGLSARHYDDPEYSSWDVLPRLVLINIFCKSQLKDRLQSIPLVCKSWKSVIDDPRCWSSMIPDSVSPEDAFIKDTSGYKFESYRLIPPNYYESSHAKIDDHNYLDGLSRLFNEEVPIGVSRLRTLLKKSGGGAAITTIYLSPFFPYDLVQGGHIGETYDEILRLIANCCPNLKHISFDVWGHICMEALGRLFNSCKKLELIDFSYLGIYNSNPLVIQLLGSCCLPNLQGIRISGDSPNNTAVSIAAHLPQLNLLSFQSDSLTGKDLYIILVSCLKLQYLHVHEYGRRMLHYFHHNIIRQASSQIPEFHFDDYDKYRAIPKIPESTTLERYDEYQSADCNELDKLNYFEEVHDYYCFDYYYDDDDILPRRKKKKEYICFSFERKEGLKEYHYMLKKMKDQYDYADHYSIQSK